MNPYWICTHLKLVKIRHKSYWNLWTSFAHESLLNLRASKPSQNSTWILTEICGQFLRMNPYWICAHLNLVKIRHKSLLNLWTIFAHESLLNLRASKPTQNSTWILTEICGQFLRMNPYWICAHLKLVKIWHKSLLEFVDNFCAWILTEFARI